MMKSLAWTKTWPCKSVRCKPNTIIKMKNNERLKSTKSWFKTVLPSNANSVSRPNKRSLSRNISSSVWRSRIGRDIVIWYHNQWTQVVHVLHKVQSKIRSNSTQTTRAAVRQNWLETSQTTNKYRTSKLPRAKAQRTPLSTNNSRRQKRASQPRWVRGISPIKVNLTRVPSRRK